MQEAIKVPQFESEDEAAERARRLSRTRVSDYVSVLMQMQQKRHKSSVAINYTSSQQPDLSWQSTLEWMVSLGFRGLGVRG